MHPLAVQAMAERGIVIIEVVDSREHLEVVLPEFDRMMSGGLITMEKVRVQRYEA